MSRLRGASRRSRLLLLFVAAGLFILLFGVVVPVPRIVALRFFSPSTTAFLEARRERLLSAGSNGRIDRRPVTLDKVSPHLVTAVLVAEDARFFEHHGIDWDAVKAARARNRRNPKRRPVGASTITQQLAKNLWLSSDRSWLRKGREAAIALTMELLLPKR
ncbi:MAG TPA: transglycosylase domain-containing protein, partial [Thermoanaerobaculia bacterium]|nr:transglycosylase domain-containing protein [Thermoanaerobaculia bacterium]